MINFRHCLFSGLLLIVSNLVFSQAHINDYIYYNDGAEVTVQSGCLVTVQGDMTNNGTPDPSVVHITNNGFVWIQGNTYGDDALEQRGNGTLRLMNTSSTGGAPYTGQYQVISGGYRVRGCQSAIGATDGSFYNLELGNDQGLVFIKTNDADVRNNIDFKGPNTTEDGNVIDASTTLNRILTYDPGSGASPAAFPANGSNYTTVFGMMNNTAGLGKYLNNTITANGTTSAVDNGYIQGKHRRAIGSTGGAFGYPLGLEPSTSQGRGVQYSLFTHVTNTYDCITGYFQQGSDNTGNATTICTVGIPDCWSGTVHGEWIMGSSASGGGTGAYNYEIFPQHFGCTLRVKYAQTKNDRVASQLSGTDNCETSPVTLDQNWPQGIAPNTQYDFVGYLTALPLKLTNLILSQKVCKIQITDFCNYNKTKRSNELYTRANLWFI